MKQTIFFLLLVLFAFSCKNSSPEVGYDYSGNNDADMLMESDIPVAREAPSKPTPDIKSPEKPIQDKKKIIKDGKLWFKVAELENAKKRVDGILEKHEGYFSSEQLHTSDYESSYELKARVPNKNFETFVKEVEEGEGEITYKSINARDVTEQFVDLETRLENKRNYLNRYRELLKKANSIKEILEVEEKIRELEEEIESTEGRLKYLIDQVAYSSLEIKLTQEKDYKYKPRKRDSFGERLKRSLAKGWYGFIDFVLAILRIWPFWIILLVGFYMWRKFRRKKRASKK